VLSPRNRTVALLTAAATLLSTVVIGLAAAPAANAATCPASEAEARIAIEDLNNGFGNDFSGCSFAGYNLSGLAFNPLTSFDNASFDNADLSGSFTNEASFSNASFVGATMVGFNAAAGGYTRFDNANLTNANLTNANLTNAYALDSVWTGATLRGANLENAYLYLADLRDADLSTAQMRDAYLSDARLDNANLTNANLWRTYLNQANLTNADLSGAVLDARTNLDNANLTGANLTGITGSDVNFTGSNVTGTNWSGLILGDLLDRFVGLGGLNLTGANFTNANLSGVIVTDANFTDVTWTGATCPDGQRDIAHVDLACDNPLDTTDPTIDPIVNGISGENGWFTSDVTVTWTCGDDTYLDSCTEPTTVTAEGTTVVSGTASDAAGNSTTVDYEVNIDRVAPTISLQVDGTPNSDGSYNAPVDFTFVCDDATSGAVNCPTGGTLTVNGLTSFTATVYDNAGNKTSLPVTVRLVGGTDPFTLGVPVITGVTPGKTYPYGTKLKPTCTATTTWTAAVVTAPTGTDAVVDEPTCTGKTTVADNGRVNTYKYKATASYTAYGVTRTTTKTVTWYTAAKPVEVGIKIPALQTTKSGMPIVAGGFRYGVKITVPKGTTGTPKWLLSVRTDKDGKTGNPTVVLKGIKFKKVNATTWLVTYSPTKAQKGQYRKFAIAIGGKRYTATTYVK
jgi:uncharacterized protein YjbI with pentapeptide repeats